MRGSETLFLRLKRNWIWRRTLFCQKVHQKYTKLFKQKCPQRSWRSYTGYSLRCSVSGDWSAHFPRKKSLPLRETLFYAILYYRDVTKVAVVGSFARFHVWELPESGRWFTWENIRKRRLSEWTSPLLWMLLSRYSTAWLVSLTHKKKKKRI